MIIDVKNGSTALMWSAWMGHKEIVEMLLKLSNIDINMQDKVCLQFIDLFINA